MRLSSSFTIWFRAVMPAGWALCLPVVLLVRMPQDFEPMRWVWVAGIGILLLQWAAWFVRLKHVDADSLGIVISDGSASARVPWSQVAGIRKPWWGKEQFARLELRTETRFGRTVLIMLPLEPFTRWSRNSSVQTVTDHLVAAGEPLRMPSS